MDHLTYELLTQRRDDVKLSNENQVITFLEWRAKLENMFERRMSEKKSETIFTETEKVRKNRNGAETKISKNQGTLLWQKQGFRALFISTALKKLSWIVL